MKLVVLVASKGKNAELGDVVKKTADAKGFNTEIINLVDLNLPLYSSVEEEKGIPEKALELTNKLTEAKAMVVISPEYNGSMAPTINNSIAWISRSTEDWRGAFNGKPAIIATHSGGGGAHVLMAMRQQLSYLGSNVIGRQLLTNYGKELNIESLESCLEQVK
jgi:NAD(P)H-dependent FMN reductase